MSKQTIQVVAFRRDSLTDNIDRTKPFYLDITNAPEIRVNYNFEDVLPIVKGVIRNWKS